MYRMYITRTLVVVMYRETTNHKWQQQNNISYVAMKKQVVIENTT